MKKIRLVLGALILPMLVIVLLVSLFPGTMSSPAPRWVPISPPTAPDAADFEPFLQDGQFPDDILSDGFYPEIPIVNEQRQKQYVRRFAPGGRLSLHPAAR